MFSIMTSSTGIIIDELKQAILAKLDQELVGEVIVTVVDEPNKLYNMGQIIKRNWALRHLKKLLCIQGVQEAQTLLLMQMKA